MKAVEVRTCGSLRCSARRAAPGCRRWGVLATFIRPGPEITRALRESVQSDSLPVFAEVQVPFLLVVASRSLPEVPPELEPLMVAFRAGLRRDLGALVAARPNIRIHELDASHAVLFEQPHEVTELITAFVAQATSRGPSRQG